MQPLKDRPTSAGLWIAVMLTLAHKHLRSGLSDQALDAELDNYERVADRLLVRLERRLATKGDHDA